MENDTSCKQPPQKTEVAIIIEKKDFKTKSITKDNERHFIRRRNIHQEVYNYKHIWHKNRVPKHIMQRKWREK